MPMTKSDLQGATTRLEAAVAKARSEVVWWVVGVGFAQVGLVIAGLTLLPR